MYEDIDDVPVRCHVWPQHAGVIYVAEFQEAPRMTFGIIWVPHDYLQFDEET